MTPGPLGTVLASRPSELGRRKKLSGNVWDEKRHESSLFPGLCDWMPVFEGPTANSLPDSVGLRAEGTRAPKFGGVYYGPPSKKTSWGIEPLKPL